MNREIAILVEDGIGPEVIQQGPKVVKVAEETYNQFFSYKHGLVEAAAMNDCGNPFPKAQAKTTNKVGSKVAELMKFEITA